MEKLILIKTLQQLSQLKEVINEAEFIAYDTETTGTGKHSKIIGFSIATDVDTGYYVVLSRWDTEQQTLIELETSEQAKETIQLLVGKKIICHNGVYDCSITFNNFGISLIESLHTDTMLLSHTLDENRSHGLKELGVTVFGDDAKKEQTEMKASVIANGGVLTKKNYELYKADADLLGKYGAKDAILTLKLFYEFVPKLFEQNLDKFFYEEEVMPLLKGVTYELNTVGLRVDQDKLRVLRRTLETEILEAKGYIYKEIEPYVKEKYPAKNEKTTFNINSPTQLSWLLYHQMGLSFKSMTESGRNLCFSMGMKLPYSDGAKHEFTDMCRRQKGEMYEDKRDHNKLKKIRDYWTYLASDKATLAAFANRYRWIAKYLEYAKNVKILKTYVSGIESRMDYNIINPSFLQHGTTSGRYSSSNPNFQNLPRDDKRVKSVIVSRPGKVFIGADYSQLEPRVFASVSQDPTLLECFSSGKDFYSVVGVPMFNKEGVSLYKSDKDSFANRFPELRNMAKAFALATPYGTSAFRQSVILGRSKDECQEIIDKYFAAYPKVELMMLESHEEAKSKGVVYSLYGRPRRIPDAKEIPGLFGDTPHGELPYQARNLLNLSMNHRVQSSAASIMNRASIAMHKMVRQAKLKDCHIVMQVHDELIVECLAEDAEVVSEILRYAMETTTLLPGVDLVAEPKIAKNLADLK